MDVRSIPVSRSSGSSNQLASVVPLRELGAAVVGPVDQSSARANEDTVAVAKSRNANSMARSEATSRFNDGISTGNLIADAVSTLDAMLTDIEGVTARAREPNLEDSERANLEIQARDIAGAFSDRAAFPLPNGEQPFRGDVVSFLSDQQGGFTNPLTFPDTKPAPLKTIETVNFSSAEATAATTREVEQTRSSLNGFIRAAATLQTALGEQSKRFAVASQNQTAAAAVVSDVDRASVIAKATQGLIGDNPAQALDASFVRASRVARLLGG